MSEFDENVEKLRGIGRETAGKLNKIGIYTVRDLMLYSSIQLAERQQMLNRFMHNLVDIADLYDVAVVITNQAQAAPDILYRDPTKAVGGHVVAHAVTYRIYLRKSSKGVRVAAVKDSPEHPPSQTVFMIAKEGLIDVEK